MAERRLQLHPCDPEVYVLSKQSSKTDDVLELPSRTESRLRDQLSQAGGVLPPAPQVPSKTQRGIRVAATRLPGTPGEISITQQLLGVGNMGWLKTRTIANRCASPEQLPHPD